MRLKLIFLVIWACGAAVAASGWAYGPSSPVGPAAVADTGMTMDVILVRGAGVLLWTVLLTVIYGITVLMRHNWRAMLQERAMLAAITDSMAEGLYVVDGKDRIQFANRAAESLLGEPPGALVGEPSLDRGMGAAPGSDDPYFHRMDGTAFPVTITRRPIAALAEDPRIMRDRGPLMETLTTWMALFDDWLEGNRKPGKVTAMPQPDTDTQEQAPASPSPMGSVVTFADISDRLARDAELRKLSRAVEQSTAAVLITDAQGVIEYVNPTFERTTGYSAREAIGETPRILKSGLVPEQVYKELWDSVCAGKEWRGELQNRRKDGTLYWEQAVISPIVDEKGKTTHLVAIKDDVTARKAIEKELFHRANYDSLTNLPNRQLAMDRLSQALAARNRSGLHVGVFFIDMDNFKQVNDTQGHDAGDQLLCEVAERFRAVIRPQDTIARLGGDEFLVVLPELPDVGDAARVAGRMVESAHEPFVINGKNHYLSASIGVSIAPEDGVTPEELLKHADAAMYQAKDNGRGITVFFTPDVAKTIQRRISVENRLRDAVDVDGLSLALQPLMDVRSGHMAGCEVLCRWTDAELGAVSPVEFIPVAEETGMIHAIGNWVLDTACAEAAKLRDHVGPDFKFCINASPAQFARGGFPAQVAAALERHGLKAEMLEIEITERLVLKQSEDILEQLRALRALGVRLALDDFGTGYSALNYLHSFQFDTLKIDRSFVVAMAHDERAHVLTKSIIDMAKGLGVEVVGEGVETAAHVDGLAEMGCGLFQGFVFSPPLDPKSMRELVEHNKGQPWIATCPPEMRRPIVLPGGMRQGKPNPSPARTEEEYPAAVSGS